MYDIARIFIPFQAINSGLCCVLQYNLINVCTCNTDFRHLCLNDKKTPNFDNALNVKTENHKL